ncbi:MAG: tetratricopeptide repeat protein [Rubrivivax sp.]
MSELLRPIVLSAMLAAIVPAQAQPLQDAQSAVARQDWAAALRLLQPLARDGLAQAQLQLGLLHYHGQGVPENNDEARRWIERAARQGLAEAQFRLGTMYAFGHAAAPADEDPNRLAALWFFEAASQGHADAQYSLGILFLTGSGVVNSPDEAEKWIARAAAQGHADARAYLAGAPRVKAAPGRS